MIAILACDDYWICIEDRGARVVKPYTPVREACCIIWLSARTSGEMTFQGDKSHAAALIERKELKGGSIDLESRVFVHNVLRLDTANQAAYSIAPLAQWLEISNWAKKQPNHCVITSPTALAWSVIKTGQAVVIQDRLSFTFWAVVQKRIIHCSLVAMGPEIEDIRFAAEALGVQVHAALPKGEESSSLADSTGLIVKWLSVVRQHDEVEHSTVLAAFTQTARLEVESADAPYDTHSELGVISSALTRLALTPPTQSILGPRGGRSLLRAELWLPACAGLSLLFSAGVLGMAIHWWFQAGQIDTETQLHRAEFAHKRGVLSSPVKKVNSNAELESQLALIASMRNVQNGYDVEHILHALKRSVRGGMRVLGVRSIDAEKKPNTKPAATPERQPRAFIVDGVLPDSNDYDVLLSQFIRSLSHSGYTAEAIDVATAAAASTTSVRLFSYRVYPSPTQ